MSGLKFTFKARIRHAFFNLRYGRGQWVDARDPFILYRETATVHGSWTWVTQCVKCVNRPATTFYLGITLDGRGLRVCQRCANTMQKLQVAGADVSKLPRLKKNGFPYQGIHGLKSEDRFFNFSWMGPR